MHRNLNHDKDTKFQLLMMLKEKNPILISRKNQILKAIFNNFRRKYSRIKEHIYTEKKKYSSKNQINYIISLQTV